MDKMPDTENNQDTHISDYFANTETAVDTGSLQPPSRSTSGRRRRAETRRSNGNSRRIPTLVRTVRHTGATTLTERFFDDKSYVLQNRPADNTPQPPLPREAVVYGCLSCTEELPRSQMILAPCSHAYCRTCLERFADLTMQREAMFPLHCCNKTIPVSISNNFSEELVKRYEAKRVEFETPATRRIWCSNQPCSAFIPLGRISLGTAHCTVCQSNTCTKCKGKWHKGDCLADPLSQEVLSMGESSGWKKCPKCGHLIEKPGGCDLMSKLQLFSERCVFSNFLQLANVAITFASFVAIHLMAVPAGGLKRLFE